MTAELIPALDPVRGTQGWRDGPPTRQRRPPRFPGSRLVSRAGDRLGRRGREILAVMAGSVAVSCLMTWPTLRHPTRTVPQDLIDPMYFVWQIAWTGHALRTDPAGLWTTNAFNHASGNLAYTDTMIGYAPFTAVFDAVHGGVGAALLSYNLLYVLVAALAFGGAYCLARVLGARVPGALVMAAAYGFAPWRLAHARHLNVLSTGGIVLAFALLAYGHGWTLRRRAARQDTADRITADEPVPPRPIRPGWILAGWAVACWQLTLGFAVGIPFAWVMAGVLLTAAVIGWRSPWPRALVSADLAGGLAFAVTGGLLTIPYQNVINRFPVAERTEAMVFKYSPPPRGLLVAPAESWWWHGIQSGWRATLTSPGEQALLPGVVLAVLALAGLFWSAWSIRARVGLALCVLGFGVLALGVSAPGGGEYTYLFAFRHLPGWGALRTPGRLVLWCSLALGLLAAGAVTAAADRLHQARRMRASPSRASRWVRGAVLLVPVLLVLGEGRGAVAQPVVHPAPVALRTLPGPVLVLPTSMQRDYTVMTWSTDGWPALINGGSGFEPPFQSKLRRIARQFPSPKAGNMMRELGVRTVVLAKAAAPDTTWAQLAQEPPDVIRAQATAMGATVRDTGPALVYDLEPTT